MAGDWVPPGKQRFVNPLTGEALAGGFVFHYIPVTDTAKDTWQDQALTILNSNPIELDGAGECTIWGGGLYRQRLLDADLNEIWDRITGVSSGSTPVDPILFFDQTFEFLGGTPAGADEIMGIYVAVRDQRIFGDFDGSGEGYGSAAGVCLVAPADGDVVVEVLLNNSVSVGTMTIAQTTGAFVFATTASADIDLVIGDYLVWKAPTVPDSAWADTAWTITGLDV